LNPFDSRARGENGSARRAVSPWEAVTPAEPESGKMSMAGPMPMSTAVTAIKTQRL